MPATFRAWVSLIVALYLLGFHFLNTVHFRQHKPITKHTVYFVSSHTWLSLASFYLGQRWRSQEHQVVVLRTSKYLEDLRQRSCGFFFARSLAMCVCMLLNVSSSYIVSMFCRHMQGIPTDTDNWLFKLWWSRNTRNTAETHTRILSYPFNFFENYSGCHTHYLIETKCIIISLIILTKYKQLSMLGVRVKNLSFDLACRPTHSFVHT